MVIQNSTETCINGSSVSGTIRHENYDNNENLRWDVSSSCDSVHVVSILFDLNPQILYLSDDIVDEVRIDHVGYYGETVVNQIVPPNFTVTFFSGEKYTAAGFVLSWRCTEWAEWNVLSDGTCRQARRPLNRGTTTIINENFKYRTNSTCRK